MVRRRPVKPLPFGADWVRIPCCPPRSKRAGSLTTDGCRKVDESRPPFGLGVEAASHGAIVEGRVRYPQAEPILRMWGNGLPAGLPSLEVSVRIRSFAPTLI